MKNSYNNHSLFIKNYWYSVKEIEYIYDFIIECDNIIIIYIYKFKFDINKKKVFFYYSIEKYINCNVVFYRYSQYIYYILLNIYY